MARLKGARHEVLIRGRRRLDFRTSRIAREEERSGNRKRMRKAISRLLSQRNFKKELGVPQWDTLKAIEEVRKKKANITVTNITRTKKIRP